ncbi:gluconokinase [Pedobacter steynii]|uniref:Gluconokinase n=1 Tax=Pedobacter steynii TaxID=430522 RepID=A0A1H0EGB9_9SPHI|nr:gluconokinase [Pedobacter steynii]NQX42008.1 gluconokinase [Pedobacter steynii]SDN81402.1 gluconokinase [Pedobacter steynii]
MEYILGMDIGTGSTKGVALDLNYEPIDSVQHYYASDSPMAGYSEQEPEVIWAAFKKCIAEIIDRMGSSPVAIGLSSAMHSLISVDEDCIPLAPMMTWADSRSSGIARRIRASEQGINIYKRTGTPIHAMSPLCKIVWLREHQPELFDRAYKFISIKEYIWYQLFKEFKIDHSIASCTGLFDVEQLNWSENALLMAGITEDRLSVPVDTSYSRKDVSGIIFVIGASDGCLANLGSDAVAAGVAALTIGTSGAIRISSRKPIVNEQAMTFSYLLDEQTYICGGPVNNGGIALQWFLKNALGKEELIADDYTSFFERASATTAGSKGLIFLPYLTGERAPIWDSESCGTFFGLRLHHRQEHFSRAVLEGICYALNEVLQAVEQYAEEIKQINVSGGFVQSRIWMEILADITGKEIVLLQTEDASAVGAAYLAIKAMGLHQDYPSYIKERQRIEPNLKNHELYRKIFKIYQQLYPNLKESMCQLDRLHT